MGIMTADTADEPSYGIRAVERTCDLLDTLATVGKPVSMSDLAVACGLPKTSVFRYLATLESRQYVERVSDGQNYRLGIGVHSLRADNFERIGGLARPYLEGLRDEFGETANLGVLVGRQIAYVDIVESPHSVRLAARPLDRDALYCTALGKAMAADIEDNALTTLIGIRYEPRTSKTMVDWSALRENLRLVREQGYAIDDEENEIGGRCVAVKLPLSSISAAISISSVSPRMPMDSVPTVAGRLKVVADALASKIGVS